LAYLGGICWTLAYDTIYAHQDKIDDARVGIKSTALLLNDRPHFWVGLFYFGAIFFLALAGWGLGDGLGYGYRWGLTAAAAFAVVQLILWRPDDPDNCLRRFKANRDFGLIVLLGIVLGKIV
jgi:4-hydroxybenzoate polyprenyltransferase